MIRRTVQLESLESMIKEKSLSLQKYRSRMSEREFMEQVIIPYVKLSLYTSLFLQESKVVHIPLTLSRKFRACWTWWLLSMWRKSRTKRS